MNYEKHYLNLIDRAKYRQLDCYTETHHIIPKCIGGTDDNSNLVNLTPEEHFVAHLLLVKIYPNNRKLLFSARMMTISPIGKRTKNKMYGWLKRKISESGHSMETREKISKSHLGSKRSEETKAKMSILQKERGGYGPKIFSDSHRKKISDSLSGRKLDKRTKEHCDNLSKSLMGKAKTPGFSGKTHTEESKNKASFTQISKNLEPWETGAIVSNQKCLLLWKQLDVVYNAWIETGSKGHRRICNYLNMPLESSVENMIKWFKKNGNPINHSKWLTFKGK